MADIKVGCACGKVRGTAQHASARSGTRLVCYCKDCQAYADWLGTGSITDKYGGTDIFQIPLARLVIKAGADQIRCMRLSPTGTYRWYTGCCRTPIGNTREPGVPLVGIIKSFFTDAATLDRDIGPSRGINWGASAKPDAPDSILKAQNSRWLKFRVIRKVLLWNLLGLGKPSMFFTDAGEPVVKPEILHE